ncbi:medium-chain dehydrogenase/reductase like protein [Irpex rosettiformis]|uniref:Medium-chain dehydrogenase/reductase like protein n=1 Tax=Irpex rosettiformis TaxID=378272 RepID=A0ACB8UAC1_9APHY|nr:medium-chain dehydrogenase/reductase like protein [Irpex rosettiformis]
MPTHKALLLVEKLGNFVVRDIETPKPGPGELLVEVKAAGVNPRDWKIQSTSMSDFVTHYPAVLGMDAAGVVKEVGVGVTGFDVADRVVYQGFYPNRQATFQQYSIAIAEVAAKGATIPLAINAAAFGLYSGKISTGELRGAGLVPVWEEGGRGKYADQPFLVIGGSSSLGQQAIQLAKLSGFNPIITTASPHNAEFLKSLGATHVIDRSAPLSTSVKAITPEPIKYVHDVVSSKETQEAAYEVVAPGGTLILVLASAIDESKADKSVTVASTFGTAHDPAQRALGVGLYKNLTQLLESGDIKPNKVEVIPNGLAGLPDGLEKLKAHKVSASKLIAQPWA